MRRRARKAFRSECAQVWNAGTECEGLALPSEIAGRLGLEAGGGSATGGRASGTRGGRKLSTNAVPGSRLYRNRNREPRCSARLRRAQIDTVGEGNRHLPTLPWEHDR